ncbi:CRISPR-associated endonuclease Cas2 [Leucobacter sp. OH2974_COT-288]|uniref:CRISPR-associated endoribonuclease Cas2 n=1 Tax=Canibacter oris TaxID=1365628 RepID=A0A840DEN9_9MICO|nr:CRISPR-associated endonuclease Cas2 [Canibacter oris]MBB4071534.1 CRISPR-associated protein Cas2 [Canibacter oris]RRD36332.1 CRISPR-associated endonuclease Cas2 [Leucobacter sp. OH2974_COT-288]
MPSDPMWAVVMFDLPTQTKTQRRNYTKFRNLILDLGFCQMQYSVYQKYCISGPLPDSTVKEIKAGVPPQGHVRIMHVTDRQWAATICFSNATEETPEETPTQLAFF